MEVKRDIYGDESSHNAHHYMVLTVVSVSTEDAPAIVEEINAVRDPRWVSQEIKWTKTNATILPCYRAVVDKCFELCAQDRIHCHSLIVDCTRLDHHRFNSGDPELGFNKFNYQLLMKCGRSYGDDRLYVYLDQRSSVHRPAELGEIVNNGLWSRWSIGPDPVKKCVHCASKKSLLIQVADLFAGAIAFHKNDHDKRDTVNSAKIDLATHIASHIGRERLGGDTPYRERRFTQWNFLLR